MTNMIRLGAISALLIAGPALAANDSKVSYTLELGGNNHASGPAPSWENMIGCVPPAFTSGSTSDGQSFSAGAVLTWAARVFVSGTHSNGFAPSGAANLVANMELHAGSATGALVSIGHGTPTTGGFFSTINDGDNDGTRSVPTVSGGCGEPADPLEDAAFAVGFDIREGGYAGPVRGRVIDGPADNGPFLDYFMYPSDAGHPAGSTAASGKLLGIGAGYSRYAGYGCPSECGFGNGLNTAGVGRASGPASCGVLLGNGPVFEGQINTSGLTAGTYVLVLVPGSGNNIVNGNFLCDSADPGAFALAPDLASVGDDITFTLSVPGGPNATITAWRSVRTHTGAGDLPIVLNATAVGNGTSGPTVETRGPNSTPGIQKVQLDFSVPVGLGNTAAVVVTQRITTPGGTPVMGSPTSVTPATVTMFDADTMQITFAAGQIPNMSCINISIGAAAITGATLIGDTDVNIRSLYADVNSSGTVSVADQLATKLQNSATLPGATKYDVNLSGGTISVADQLAVKTQNANPVKTALCP